MEVCPALPDSTPPRGQPPAALAQGGREAPAVAVGGKGVPGDGFSRWLPHSTTPEGPPGSPACHEWAGRALIFCGQTTFGISHFKGFALECLPSMTFSLYMVANLKMH